MFENLLGRFRGIELEEHNGQFVSKPGRIPLESIFLESYGEWMCFSINRVTFLEYIEFRVMVEVAQELRLPNSSSEDIRKYMFLAASHIAGMGSNDAVKTENSEYGHYAKELFKLFYHPMVCTWGCFDGITTDIDRASLRMPEYQYNSLVSLIKDNGVEITNCSLVREGKPLQPNPILKVTIDYHSLLREIARFSAPIRDTYGLRYVKTKIALAYCAGLLTMQQRMSLERELERVDPPADAVYKPPHGELHNLNL
ncbi:hypothetical protein [uncultured Duncaniella sp.]|uniref:hypothetical protein n=1 Tax=uncultured Duncaniella sp. TaxID=2768039 RepID=UPI0025AA23D2|nr:hypothetical protein [uncultured Duncaniella sp.]